MVFFRPSPQEQTIKQSRTRLGRAGVPGGRGSVSLRLLDRTLALAALVVLAPLRRSSAPALTPRRIGLMKTAGIGDMVLLTAIARDLSYAFPDAELVVFGGPENIDIATMVEGTRAVGLPTARPWSAIPLLRRERLDVLLDFGQWTRLEALYAALSRAGWTCGFETAGQRRHYAYDSTVPHSGQVPEIENFRQLARQLGVESSSEPEFDGSPTPAPPPVPEPYVVFHMWAGGFRSELREWPSDRWRDLAGRFAAAGFSIVLTGGPGDAVRTEQFVRSCDELSPAIASVAGRYRLPELVDVLAGARCVISVNTGVMHLAAAVGAPTVALNGPTSSLRWGPIGPDVVCIDSDLPGCGYLNLGFEYEGQRTDCMEGISVRRVAQAALERANV